MDTEPLVILDTLGKVMPPTLNGESAYQRDYRVAGRLKRSATNGRDGAARVHHDRKAKQRTSSTASPAPTGSPERPTPSSSSAGPGPKSDGLLKITGRDVIEGRVRGQGRRTATGPDGKRPCQAAEAATTLRATAKLADRSGEVLRYVNKHPEGVRAGDVAKSVNMPAKEAGVYLGRLFDAGRLLRPQAGGSTPLLEVLEVLEWGQPSHPGVPTLTTLPTQFQVHGPGGFAPVECYAQPNDGETTLIRPERLGGS